MGSSPLARSFQKLAELLGRPRVAWRVVLGMLTVHTALLAYSAYVHSPTLNEPGHLVAGLSHWKFGRFELYRVNPPLVRMVAALPVMAVGYEEDWSGFYEGPGARPVFGMGEDFVAANGPRSFFLFMIARWACIPFSWLGAIVCYLWARDLYGRTAGLFACMLWCFEPNILAHASLMAPDAHASALGVAACYTFWKWLRRPSWSQAALTGVVLGLAELAKTTLILLYPLWPLMWLLYRWRDRASMTARMWAGEGAMLALRMAIGLYIVNLGYGFEGSFKPLNEFDFVSNTFTGKTTGPADYSSDPTAPKAVNRFVHAWTGMIPVPFPENYLKGIDVQQRDFEDYGRLSYLRGKWQDHGWWYYYLYAAAVKIPLGVWGLGLLALAISPPWRPGMLSRDEIILLLPAVVIFVVVSSKTGFNEHFRYVIPAFPYFFVILGRSAKTRLTLAIRGYRITASVSHLGSTQMLPVAMQLVTLLSCWILSTSLWVYPHTISYFNELVGGPLHGAAHLSGSSVDWGQDLRYISPLANLTYFPVLFDRDISKQTSSLAPNLNLAVDLRSPSLAKTDTVVLGIESYLCFQHKYRQAAPLAGSSVLASNSLVPAASPYTYSLVYLKRPD